MTITMIAMTIIGDWMTVMMTITMIAMTIIGDWMTVMMTITMIAMTIIGDWIFLSKTFRAVFLYICICLTNDSDSYVGRSLVTSPRAVFQMASITMKIS